MERTGLPALPDARMSGMRILFLGVGDSRKDFVFDILAKCDVEVYAAGSLPENKMKDKVKKYIMYDQYGPSQDHLYCDVVVQKIHAEIGDVDGCLCLWDAEVPFAALVTSRLEKPGISPSGALVAKSKAKTLQTLGQTVVKGERDGSMLSFSKLRPLEDEKEQRTCTSFGSILPSTDSSGGQNGAKCVAFSDPLSGVHNGSQWVKYSSLCLSIESESEVEECVRKVGLPAVLKTEFGTGSMGTKLVHSLQEAVDHYRHIQTLHDQHRDRAYVLGGYYNKSCVLMEYLEGSEHCVDLALFHGELVCAFVSDKGPPIPPNVFKTVITMPSLLPVDKLEAVIMAAFECCRALGLDHGVIDVDIMLTKSGPKLLEINPRMGGFCLREFILHCYNVDLVHLACMIACDVRPSFELPEEISSTQKAFVPPSFMHIVGLYCHPKIHGKALKTTATSEILTRLHDNHQLIFIQYEPCLRELDHETPYCTVAVKAETFGKARARLVDLCRETGLETDGLSVKTLLDFFTDNCNTKKDLL